MLPNGAFQLQAGQHPHPAPMATPTGFGIQPTMYAHQAMAAHPHPHQPQQAHPHQFQHAHHPQSQQQQQQPMFSPTAQVHMVNGPNASAFHANLQHQAQMGRMPQSHTPQTVNGQPPPSAPPSGGISIASPFSHHQHAPSPQAMSAQQQHAQPQSQMPPQQPPPLQSQSQPQPQPQTQPQPQPQQSQSQPLQPHQQPLNQQMGPHSAAHQNSPMAHSFAQPHPIPGRAPTPLAHSGIPMQSSGSGSGQPSVALSVSSPQVGGSVPLRPASSQQVFHPSVAQNGPPTPTHSRPHSAGHVSATTPTPNPASMQPALSIMTGTPLLRSASNLATSPAMPPGNVPLPGPGPSLSSAHANSRPANPMSATFPASSAMPNAPGPHPHLQSLFPPGSGVLRLIQYSEGLGAGIDRCDIDYWRAFVNEFFVPSGVFRLVLWNPASREQKGFEVPISVLPRYFYTSYVSGKRSTQLLLDNPREYTTGYPPTNSLPPPPASTKFLNSFPSPNVTHLVDASRATLISNFDNGWQIQMIGLLRASFVPYARIVPSGAADGGGGAPKIDFQLRLESLDYLVHAHTGYIPRPAIQKTKVEQSIPTSLISSILGSASNGGDSGSSPTFGSAAMKKKESKKGLAGKDKKEENDPDGLGEGLGKAEDEKLDSNTTIKSEDDRMLPDDDRTTASGFTVPVEKTIIPDYPVNEYGISLRAMRCLEITESVCQLRDLIDLSMRDQLGPIDSLRKFAAQYREMQQNRPAAAPQQPSMNGNGTGITGGASSPSVAGGIPARPPSAQGQILAPSEHGINVGSSPANPSVPLAAGTKRKGKAAPSPSRKLGNVASPSKRPR